MRHNHGRPTSVRLHSFPSRHMAIGLLTRPAAAPKFSLADEARYVSNHRSAAFEAGKNLRHMPIHFISAGHLEGTLKDKEQEQKQEQERMPDVEPARAESSEASSESIAPSSPSSSTPDNARAMAHMAIRSPSPAVSESSSSTDEVLFRGRCQPPAHTTNLPSRPAPKVSAPPATPQPTAASTDAPTIATETEQTQASVERNVRVHQPRRSF
jgi:hypothetical protein